MNDKELTCYYMVHNWTRGVQGQINTPQKMHRTFNGAKGEACRLARAFPGDTFVILTSGMAYRVDAVPVIEIHINSKEVSDEN